MSAQWSRRRVLGATLGATLGVAGAAWIAGSSANAVVGRLVVVQDGRFASSRRHAHGLARRAHRTIDAREDLARLWYRELRLEATRTPLAFAGLTTWSDYVVLRGCAAEAGLRESRYELIRGAGGRGCTLVRWQIGGPSA